MKRPVKPLNPLAVPGVNRGGSQGRMTTVHNGLGGVKAGGGVRAGATPKRLAPTPRFHPQQHANPLLTAILKMQKGS